MVAALTRIANTPYGMNRSRKHARIVIGRCWPSKWRKNLVRKRCAHKRSVGIRRIWQRMARSKCFVVVIARSRRRQSNPQFWVTRCNLNNTAVLQEVDFFLTSFRAMTLRFITARNITTFRFIIAHKRNNLSFYHDLQNHFTSFQFFNYFKALRKP